MIDGHNSADQPESHPREHTEGPPPPAPIAGSQDRGPIAQCEKKQRGDCKKESNLTRTLAFIAAIGGAAAGVFSAVQACIAHDTEVKSNRAIVISNSLNLISYSPPATQDRAWTMYPVIESVGNTQTKYLRFYSDFAECGNPNLPLKQFSVQSNDPQAYRHQLIGPKSNVSGTTATFQANQCNGTVADIIVSGIIKYSDIFSYVHLTEFCNYIVRVDSLGNYPAGQAVRINAIPCNQHNCTDEECGPDWEQRARN